MEGMKNEKTKLIVVCIVLVTIVISSVAVVFLLTNSKDKSENNLSGNKGESSSTEDIFQGYTPYIINSESMMPTLKVGDVILTEEVKDVTELKVGDVITYITVFTDADGRTVRGSNTHRIVAIEYNSDNTINHFVTRGDAMDTEDNVPVIPGEILGKQVNSGYDENGNIKEGLKIENFEKTYGDFSDYIS